MGLSCVGTSGSKHVMASRMWEAERARNSQGETKHSLWHHGLQIVLVDDRRCPVGRNGQGDARVMPNATPATTPVDLELDWVLGKMPRKACGVGGRLSFPSPGPFALPVLCRPCASLPPGAHTRSPSVLQEFFLQRTLPLLQPLVLPPGLSVRQALERVLRLPAVASKRYLTNKVRPALLPWHSVRCPLPPARPPLASHPWGLLWGSPDSREKGQGSHPHGLCSHRPCVPAPCALANPAWLHRWTAPWAAWWPSSSVSGPCRLL